MQTRKISILMVLTIFCLVFCIACGNGASNNGQTDNRVSEEGEVSVEATLTQNRDEALDGQQEQLSSEELGKAERIYMQKFSQEDMVVIPEVVEYTYEEAVALGEGAEYSDILPGASEGVWHVIEVGGIVYFYGKYDHLPEEESPTLLGAAYAIVDEQYALSNGLKVGMTEEEVLKQFPNMAVVDFENHPVYEKVWGCMGFNTSHYPEGDGYAWLEQFDYVMLGDVEQGSYDALPMYVGLMIKDKVVSAITFHYPTAG